MNDYMLRNKTQLTKHNVVYFRNLFKVEILQNDGIKLRISYKI